MTTIRTIQYSQFTVLAAVLCLSLCGCHSQPEVQEHQPTAAEQKKFEQDYQKAMEEQKKLTSGYDHSMQYVPPSTGYVPSKKQSVNQQAAPAQTEPQPQK